MVPAVAEIRRRDHCAIIVPIGRKAPRSVIVVVASTFFPSKGVLGRASNEDMRLRLTEKHSSCCPSEICVNEVRVGEAHLARTKIDGGTSAGTCDCVNACIVL